MKRPLAAAAIATALLPATTAQAQQPQPDACGPTCKHAEQRAANARHQARARHREQLATARRYGRWRAQARPYAGFLAHLVACESASSGGYRLQTTGNSFWFAFQFTAHTWAAVAGGRTWRGIPVGWHGERVPSRAEQDARAVRVLHVQGPGAWPVCSH